MARLAEEARERRAWLTVTCTGTVVLYLGALVMPAIYVDDGGDLFKDGSPFGLLILCFGWFGWVNFVPWSANVVLLFGLGAFLAEQFRIATALGAFATALGLTTTFVWELDSLLLGYYLWQASLMVFAGGAACAASQWGDVDLSSPPVEEEPAGARMG